MTTSDINGQSVSIEKLFHFLENRLFYIESCIRSKSEIEDSEMDYISDIKEYILAYPYAKSAAMLYSTVNEVTALIEHVKENKHVINAALNWRILPDSKKLSDIVIEELNNYKVELGSLLQKIATKQANIERFLFDVSNDRIETNLKADELGGLLYFLLKHQDGIIHTPANKVCDILSKVITTKDSQNPSSANLYNLMHKAPKNESVIKFWQGRFASFNNNPIKTPKKKK